MTTPLRAVFSHVGAFAPSSVRLSGCAGFLRDRFGVCSLAAVRVCCPRIPRGQLTRAICLSTDPLIFWFSRELAE
jgi:hypothetical protein